MSEKKNSSSLHSLCSFMHFVQNRLFLSCFISILEPYQSRHFFTVDVIATFRTFSAVMFKMIQW